MPTQKRNKSKKHKIITRISAVILLLAAVFIIATSKDDGILNKQEFDKAYSDIYSYSKRILNSDEKLTDESSCFKYLRRIFGDDERLTCTVLLKSSSVVKSQKDINDIINSDHDELRKTEDLNGRSDIAYPKYLPNRSTFSRLKLKDIGSFSFRVLDRYPCNVNYFLGKDKLSREIGCTFNTEGVFLDKYDEGYDRFE